MEVVFEVVLLDYVPHVLFICFFVCLFVCIWKLVMPDLFFFIFISLILWDTGVHIVCIEICHLNFYALVSLGCLINLLYAIRVCS
jgi:hypothetical protein